MPCGRNPSSRFWPALAASPNTGWGFPAEPKALYIPLVILVSNNSVGVPKAINFPSLTFELFDMLSGDFPNVVR